MKKELRLLLVEDVTLDAELIEHELHRAGMRFRAKRVETREAFLHELEHHPPDLILSDHGMPAFDGFMALATARQRCPEVPFIFVTGAHGDEVAVETLKRGADDYVLKSRLHRLAGSIQRALAQATERAQHRKTERALRQSRAQLHWLTEAARNYALLNLDLEGRITGWSPSAERLLGYTLREVCGRPLGSLFPQEEQSRVRRALQRAAQETSHPETGWRVLRKDGLELPASVLLAVSRADHGPEPTMVCVLCDLTPEKKAAEESERRMESLIRHRTAQIEADYRELQELTCTLAVDLRTPLRHIDGFVELLHKTAADRLDPKGQSSLKTIAESARQMGHLLDELLTFARVGQVQMYRLHFNLGDVVTEVRQELRREAEGRHIEWVVGPLPEIVGDPTLLGQALNRLLTNALKFTRPRPQARIEIGSRSTENEVIVYVADNGVGFDPRYRDKLFGVFQRLHPGGEFEGLGLGLAQVRRIVQRHGGRTWAEGAPEQGATFYFSLPRPEGFVREEALET
jgi:PAS domain S-box-containing protein